MVFTLCFGLAPKATLWAQDSTIEQAEPAYNAYVEEGNYADEDKEDYEEEYNGPFYDGFSLNDTIQNHAFQERKISDEDWKKISDKSEYVYKKKEIKQKTVKDTEPNWLMQIFYAIISFLFSTAGKILMWLLLAALIIWILVAVFKNQGIYFFARGRGKIETPVMDELSDDFVPESWEDVIAKAEANQDYRLAIRHAYRHIVHQMQDKNILKLNNAQSNHQYLNALRDTAYFDDFKTLLKHYEYVWYGHYELGATSYQSVKVFYEQLKAKL